jgi:hypothetical protein
MAVNSPMLRLSINLLDGIRVVSRDLRDEDLLSLSCSAPVLLISVAPNPLAPSATTIQNALPTVNIAVPVAGAVEALTLFPPALEGSNSDPSNPLISAKDDKQTRYNGALMVF